MSTPTSPLAGGIAGSSEKVKRTLASAGQGANTRKLLILQENTPAKLRLLQEPEEWMMFYEHFVPASAGGKAAYVPALDPDPLAAHPDERVRRTSLRHMANVLDLETMTIKLLKMNQDLTNRFMVRHGRYGTLTDRAYEVLKTGTGFNTTHDLEPDDPAPLDISRFRPKFHDMTLFLLQAADAYHQTDHADEYLRATGQTDTAPMDDDDERRREMAAREEALAQARAQREADALAKYGSPDDVSHLQDLPAQPTAATPAPDALAQAATQLEAQQPVPQVTPAEPTPAPLVEPTAAQAAAVAAGAGVPWEEPVEEEALPAPVPTPPAQPVPVQPVDPLAAAAAAAAASLAAPAPAPVQPAPVPAPPAPVPVAEVVEAAPAEAAPAATAVAQVADEWEAARAQGRPCTEAVDAEGKGTGNCEICSFPLSECLVK